MSHRHPSRANFGSGWRLRLVTALTTCLPLALALNTTYGCVSDADESSSVNNTAAGSAGGGHAGSTASNARGAAGAMQITQSESAPGTFSHIYEHVLTNCKVAACHGSGLGGLDMSSRDATFEDLVDHMPNPTGDCADFAGARIVPGSTDDSLLFLKVNMPKAPCGKHMPPGGQLSESARMELAQWITDGAPDD